MPVTVTVEDGTGLADANSYASTAGADAYFATRPRSSAWTSLASADIKATYLVHATRLMDAAVNWEGDRLKTTQALAFPRVIDGEAVGVPQLIVTALYELAIALVGKDLTADPSATTGYSVIEVGPIKLETEPGARQPAMIPRFVRDLIAPYGTARASSMNVPLVRR